MIVDFHVHVSRPEHERPWIFEFMQTQYDGDLVALAEKVLTPHGLRAFLQEGGIDCAVALAEISPITTGVASNEYTIDLVRKANALPDPAEGPKGRLIAFASLNPFMEGDLAASLERLVLGEGFRGLKLYPVYQYHYPNEARLYPLYARAEALGIPILVHTGSSVFRGARIKYGDPLLLDDVAIDFPRLRLLMAHSGRPFWYEQAFWMARRHENVFLEISGLPAANLLTYFPRLEELADKVVYGSDWPGNPYLRRNIDAILRLPLKDDTKAKILGGNAARLLGLDGEGELRPHPLGEKEAA
ncbi:MAG TPA: amidohydrolase family protein [Anaerolineales bacterium]|nr:amidohydrolase family protein [Anaerolineales bacterium]